MESFLQSINQRDIELDHQHIVFVKNYTTLAWNIIPKNCSVRQILSYTPCQQNNPVIYNITTSNKTFTLSSMSFRDQMTGELVDFNISTSLECSHLSDTLRFNSKSILFLHVYTIILYWTIILLAILTRCQKINRSTCISKITEMKWMHTFSSSQHNRYYCCDCEPTQIPYMDSQTQARALFVQVVCIHASSESHAATQVAIAIIESTYMHISHSFI